MVSKKSGLVLSAIGVLMFLFSVAYISSCTRPLQEFPYSCNGIVCNNGGHCDSAKCKCPIGYEGAHCETKSIEMYYGSWRTTATTIGSDSLNHVGRDTVYIMELKQTATPTTFFMYNYGGNPYYSELICMLDSNFKYYFQIDTTSSLNMAYDHYRIRGGWGTLFDKEKDSISAKVFVQYLNSTVNWQRDTVMLSMKKL